jgi:hypothetical protein
MRANCAKAKLHSPALLLHGEWPTCAAPPYDSAFRVRPLVRPLIKSPRPSLWQRNRQLSVFARRALWMRKLCSATRGAACVVNASLGQNDPQEQRIGVRFQSATALHRGTKAGKYLSVELHLLVAKVADNHRRSSCAVSQTGAMRC